MEVYMDTAKLFQSGNSQAVRLPKDFRLPGQKVRIFRRGNQIILEPLEVTWDALFASLDDFPEDFIKSGRQQPDEQTRESF
jgi:antitoxin VapB